MNVPLLDLVAQYRAIKDDVLPALQAVIESQQFVMGPPVPQLETAVARLAHAQHGIACASGTDALLLPLKALGLDTGDEVITTPFTFFATAGAIHNAGGTPVFVDIEPGTFNIDPAAVEAAITPRTRAIVPVHLYGQMAAMERLLAIARARGLKLVEDAAQAIGARRSIDGEWRMAGELGWATGFSFFPSKNLGAWGDGGMMVTSDDALGERIIGCDHHPAVTPRAEVLAWKEGIASRPPELARRTPLSVDGAARSDRLGRVFDDLDPSPSGDRQQTLHDDHLTVQVNRHNGARAGGDRGLHRRGIDVERARVDVDEDGCATGVVDRPGRGEEGKRRRDDFVAGRQVERLERQEQCVGPARARNAVLGMSELGDGALELLHRWTHHEVLGLDDRLQGG